jgi:hypothetical protein
MFEVGFRESCGEWKRIHDYRLGMEDMVELEMTTQRDVLFPTSEPQTL